jgi:SAM-dependent methyltransferase
VSEDDLARLRVNHPSILKYKGQVLGGLEESRHYAEWTNFLLPRFGRRSSCLSVGSGHGRIEKHLIQAGFAERFEAVELSEFANGVASAGSLSMSANAGDLNFSDFGDDNFDFVLCHGVLHHIVNLEDLLWKIHRCLRPGGIVLMYEYVGEDRWQFSERRLEIVRKSVPGAKLRPPPRWSVRGFESVRSSELRNLVQQQFGNSPVIEKLYGGIYFPFVTCTSAEADAMIPQAVEADRRCSADALVEPCYMMCVYEKSVPKRPDVKVWSDDEVRRRLARTPPLGVRAYELAKAVPGAQLLKSWLLGK